eukprot:714324-Rhodomonas_salina.1
MDSTETDMDATCVLGSSPISAYAPAIPRQYYDVHLNGTRTVYCTGTTTVLRRVHNWYNGSTDPCIVLIELYSQLYASDSPETSIQLLNCTRTVLARVPGQRSQY